MVAMFGATSFGAFWQPISISIIVGGVGFLFGTLFKQDPSEYVPFFCISLILWTYFSGSLNEFSSLFGRPGEYEHFPYETIIMFPIRIISKHIFQLLLNLLIFLAVALYFKITFSLAQIAYALVGGILFISVVYFTGIIISLVGSRFSDVQNIIMNAIQILFYITPVMWKPNLLSQTWVFDYNPIYHLLHLVRGPLLDNDISIQLYFITTIVAFALLGLALLFWSIFAWRINYHPK
jgi:ABC-type polysaccharide/polyol phosphate export permease